MYNGFWIASRAAFQENHNYYAAQELKITPAELYIELVEIIF
jgi:hypothetical protein